jgi:argininosuccinate lyase
VQRGVPSRTAHEQVGKAVRYCLEKDCRLQDLTLDELRKFAPAADQDFYSAMRLNAVLASHDVTGGTHPGRVRDAINQLREKVAALRGSVHAHA